MNDVLDRLAALRSSDLSTDPGTVAADVRRGRRALYRRRAVRGGVFAAGALTVAGVAGTTLRDPAPRVQRQAGLQLVTYTGQQLPGFTIEKVPAGFVLQGTTSHNLNVTRPGNTTSIDDFVDKIVVMLEWNGDSGRQAGAAASGSPDGWRESLAWREGLAPRGVVSLERVDGRYKATFKDGHVEFHDEPRVRVQAEPPAVQPFEVDGAAATITTNDEGTKTLRYVHGGYTLAIQVWPTLDLTNAQLVEFADGVSVTAEAQPGRG